MLKKGPLVKEKIKKLMIHGKRINRLKGTDTFSWLRSVVLDIWIIKNVRKNEYATVRTKKRHYRLERKGKLTEATKETILSKIFEKQLGYEINFENPKTYNEKIMWTKIYYQNPLITKCSDKFAMKEYVSNLVGEEYVVPVIKSWTNPEQIDFNGLPDKFVIKVNWSSGYLIVVKDKNELDTKGVLEKIKKWTRPYRNSYYQTFNWGYKNMPPVIFAEEYIEQTRQQVYDYKFFCFSGRVEYLFIATDRIDRRKNTTFDFYDSEFNPLNITYGRHEHVAVPHKKPRNFEKMKEIAAKLSKPFPHVRIDFYETGDKLYVGEMTFYSGGGLLKFDPPIWDEKFGDVFKLPEKTVQNKSRYYKPLSEKEIYMMEDRITMKMQRQHCLQKAYAQMGYLPDIDNPKSFNEKVIWLALNYRNPDMKIAADKYKAKEYIAKKVGEKYIVPLIGVYEDVLDIEFDKLPDAFVCKSTAGFGNEQVIIVKDKQTCCLDYLKAQMTNWLYPWNTYYYRNMCISDEKIEPRIVIENYLEDSGGLRDYKIYCCNGKPKFALVVDSRGQKKEETRTYVDMDWQCLPVFRKGKKTAANPIKPENLDEMLDICSVLATDFPLVRIDFYEVSGRIYVGEVTFTPGMFLGLRPIEMDFKLGEALSLEKYMK